jgi:hypothetical protein
MDRFGADAALMCVSGGCRVVEATPGGVDRVLLERSHPRQCSLTLENVLLDASMINARFLRREAYARVGAFDEHFRTASDLDFLVRAALERLTDSTLGRVVMVYRQHAGSLTFNGDKLQREDRLERLAIVERFLQSARPAARERRVLIRSYLRDVNILIRDAVRHGRFTAAWHHLVRARSTVRGRLDPRLLLPGGWSR